MASPRLLVQNDGSPFSSRFFLHVFMAFMRLTLRELQTAGTHGGEFRGGVSILASPRTRCVAGNTAAASAGVCRELREWGLPMEVGLERQLSVSYLPSDGGSVQRFRLDMNQFPDRFDSLFIRQVCFCVSPQQSRL